jgi:hypothetical protein
MSFEQATLLVYPSQKSTERLLSEEYQIKLNAMQGSASRMQAHWMSIKWWRGRLQRRRWIRRGQDEEWGDWKDY